MINLKKINRYKNLSFKDFIVDNSNKEMVEYLKDYCEKVQDKIEACENIIISGSVGVGKTMISRIFQNELKNIDVVEEVLSADWDEKAQKYGLLKERLRKLNVVYVSCPQLIKALREHFTKGVEENLSYHVCDILIIDEVGVQYNTDNERITLYDLFNYRYENYRPIMLISNNELRQANKTKADGMDKILGSRIIDRVNSGSSKYFWIEGKSKRK